MIKEIYNKFVTNITVWKILSKLNPIKFVEFTYLASAIDNADIELGKSWILLNNKSEHLNKIISADLSRQ